MNKDDIYRLLGINMNAPADLVKKAFKEFARDNHPDFFPGDRLREEKFKRVTSAYQTWKLIQNTISDIARIRTASQYMQFASSGFKPWSFSCKA
jgi:curved DNA-binding protein CbpA